MRIVIIMEEIRRVNETTYVLDVTSTVTISFKLEDQFIKQLDSIVESSRYNNRSDLIREAIESYIQYLKENELTGST